MRWLTNFYDFRFKWTVTAAIGIHPNKAWLSQLGNIKNAIWTRGYFRRTICNKIAFKLGKNATESFGMLQTAFRPSCMNRASDFEWHRIFKEGRESVRDDERCGRRKNATESFGMLQTAFRPSCMNRASDFEWHTIFKEDRESGRDDERCGRSKEVSTAELIGQRARVRVTMLRF